VSEVAVPGRLSGVVPSPQSTLIALTDPSASLAENVTVTVCPNNAGFGETLFTATIGGLSFTVSDTLAEPVEPLLSVAVRVILNGSLVPTPVEEYVCVAEVEVPARLVRAVPSPQLIDIDETVPSESEAENVKVTCWPVRAGFGETPPTETRGALSFTTTELVAEPVKPLLSVAVRVMVNAREVTLPVLV
jgi:hypothetical protein